MYESMADMQCAMAEIRWGKKRRKKRPQDENMTSASATQGSHNKQVKIIHFCLLKHMNIDLIYDLTW